MNDLANTLLPGYPRTGIPMPEYLAIEALSSHGMKHILSSPADYLAGLEQKDDKPAFQLGRATHTLILERALFPQQVAIKAKMNGSTKEGKEYNAAFAAANVGKTIVDEEQYKSMLAMQESLQAQRGEVKGEKSKLVLDCLLGDTNLRRLVEPTFLWQETLEQGDLLVKNRPDVCITMPDGSGLLIDLKTSGQGDDPYTIDLNARKFGYYLQAWAQIRAYWRWTGKPASFVLVTVNTEAPNNVDIAEFAPEFMDYASGQAWAAMKRFAECKFSGHWPRRPSDIRTINLPRWLNADGEVNE